MCTQACILESQSHVRVAEQEGPNTSLVPKIVTRTPNVSIVGDLQLQKEHRSTLVYTLLGVQVGVGLMLLETRAEAGTKTLFEHILERASLTEAPE